MTGGGLSLDGSRWVRGRENFFVSVRVMRKLYRGKLLAFLLEAYRGGTMEMHGALEPLRRPQVFRRLVRRVRRKNWVVYAKAPFGGAERTLKYLARYTHRVAISNHRLEAVGQGGVRFRWRDYRDGQEKVMALSGVEFLRRFAMHLMPKGLVRIRHYGLLAPCKRRASLARCRELIGTSGLLATDASNEADTRSTDPVLCPACGVALVVVTTTVLPTAERTAFSTLWWNSS